MKAQSQAPTRKTKNAVDRLQNNKNVKAVSLAIAQQIAYYAVTVPNDVRNNLKDNVRSSAVGKQLMRKKSNLQTQLLTSSGLT